MGNDLRSAFSKAALAVHWARRPRDRSRFRVNLISLFGKLFGLFFHPLLQRFFFDELPGH